MRIIILLLPIFILIACQSNTAKIDVLGVKTENKQEFVVNGGPGSTEIEYYSNEGTKMTTSSNVVKVPIQKVCFKKEIQKQEPEKILIQKIRTNYVASIDTITNHIISHGSKMPEIFHTTETFVPKKPPKIKLEKSTDEDMLCCDRQLTFRIKFKNVGGSDAYNINVSDVIPANVIYLEGSAGSNFYTPDIEIIRNNDNEVTKINWHIEGPIPPQESGEIFYSVTCPIPKPKLQCNVRFAPKFLNPGVEGKVICKIGNRGNAIAKDVTITLNIPGGIEYKGNSYGSQEVFKLGDIEPDKTAEKILTVKMQAKGRLDNIAANVVCSNGIGCECDVPPAPTLEIKKDGPAQVNNNHPIKYTIVVRNINIKNAPATNCILTDKLPELITFKTASHNGVFDKATNIVTWKLETLKPDEMKTRTVTIIPKKGGKLVDHAQVSCDEGLTVTDTATTKVRGISALHIQSYDTEDPVEVGGLTTYIVEVTNEGFKEATGIKIVNQIPKTTKFIEAKALAPSGEEIGYKVEGDKVIFDSVPVFDAGQTIVYKITVKVMFATELLNISTLNYNEFSKSIIVEEPTYSY